MKEAEERALDHAGEDEVEASSATHLAERIIAKSDNSNPVVKYLGFSLLLTYHYVLWFEPNSFFSTALLSFNVTSMWLVNLIGTSIGVGVIAAILGRKRHLSNRAALPYATTAILVILTLLVTYSPFFFSSELVGLVISFVAGAVEGVMWVLWGEYLVRAKAKFSVIHIGAVFGCTMLMNLVLGTMLPPVIAPFFPALLVAASGIILVVQNRSVAEKYPQLLPHTAMEKVSRNILTVCLIAFVTSTACYFLVAIIPWEPFPTGEQSFTIGVIVGAGIIIAVSALAAVPKKKTLFDLLPYLIVLTIVAYALFLSDTQWNFASFLLATCVSSLLELSLIMYFGSLMQKGYFPPALTFALAVVPIRLGIALGNGWALNYEAYPAVSASITPETALVFICLLAIILVPTSKREQQIVELTTAPAAPMEVDVVCREMIEEFGLSEREGEILRLIARGKTANAIAEKLVISPHTVNTHIRHIYDKTQIRKRGELIDYINLRRDEK